MIKELCVICCREISDPVCNDCYIHQINVWMSASSVDGNIKEIFINKLKRKFDFSTINESNCVLCFHGEVSVCYYCFHKKAMIVFKEMKLEKADVRKFGKIFNYSVMRDHPEVLINSDV